MGETRSSPTVSTKLQRIAEAARRHPERAFTTLAHHINVDFLLEAYRRTRKDGATGVDGQTARDYAENLEENLQSLRDHFKSGLVPSAPGKAGAHPEGRWEGQTRPIGIPTFEEKVLQRAVTMVLGAIYGQELLGCSYGFRPGRSAHQALEAVRDATMPVGGGWVLEVDIRKFFNSLDHRRLARDRPPQGT